MKKFSLLLVIFAFSSLTNAQSIPDSCNFLINKYFIYDFGYAGVETAAQPFHFSGSEWVTAGELISAGILVYLLDKEGNELFNNLLDPATANNIVKSGSPLGNGLVMLPVFAGLYIKGVAHDNVRARQAALAGTQAFVLAAGGAWVLKQLTHRPRASQLQPADASKWLGPFHGHQYDAFPSGHTMRAFAVATVLSGLYDDHIWVGITAFSLAGYTAFSRLVSGEHWPSDVYAGALLGYLVGRGVLQFQRDKAAKCFSLGLAPDGFGLVYRF